MRLLARTFDLKAWIMRGVSENDSTNGPQQDPAAGGGEEDTQFCEIAPTLEFMCWVVVALAPLLRWINGPPVTDDQAVVQIGLVAMSLIGARCRCPAHLQSAESR